MAGLALAWLLCAAWTFRLLRYGAFRWERLWMSLLGLPLLPSVLGLLLARWVERGAEAVVAWYQGRGREVAVPRAGASTATGTWRPIGRGRALSWTASGAGCRSCWSIACRSCGRAGAPSG